LFTTLAAGGHHTCGVTTSGVALCWGNNFEGQLGIETGPIQTTPASVSTTERFTMLTAARYHTCGLTTGGVALCWGLNARGELGDGTTAGTRRTPVTVSTTELFTTLAAGDLRSAISGNEMDFAHTCGLTTNGVALCWGWNNNGQLGDGTAAVMPFPVRVAFPGE
jgi:alpha-tubulin suppressor-like RCC1 family protein